MVTQDDRVKLVNGYNLEISELEPQDAGDYVCQISDKVNRDQTHTVEILGKVQEIHKQTQTNRHLNICNHEIKYIKKKQKALITNQQNSFKKPPTPVFLLHFIAKVTQSPLNRKLFFQYFSFCGFIIFMLFLFIGCCCVYHKAVDLYVNKPKVEKKKLDFPQIYH